MKMIIDNYKERSVMYKDMYYSTVHEAQRLTELIAKGSSMVAEDRRRAVWKGAMIGGITGLVIGAITAAIILK
jgi:tetrahydromethanopterin S-methyltransferase subunit F